MTRPGNVPELVIKRNENISSLKSVLIRGNVRH